MGDLRDWSPEPNGAVTEDRLVPSSPSSTSSSSSSSSSNPNPKAIDAGRWERAEQTTQEIISHVQPSVVSEERRKEVIDYVRSLIRSCLGCEVFPFGSVPLRTYLPDGDIDLTAFGGINVEDALANDVCSVLEREDQNKAAKFVVKDVQLIRAEVKLVKCLVQNIVVDISFNQLGGLCTLCFLERVDRLIGKDHLFKRSIILIKAWCYYESRILGAHHGLISTYALETLVLYIFHIFHSSLNGPLAVIFRFLDYFSKFDWDNYCISLNGPICISSLPDITAETPENGGGCLLLSNDFLRDCVKMFSVSSKGSETSSRTFPQKHLNIVDPLKENNNLGRSVSKGNFYRIRSAFTYGARKLRSILSLPEENLADELRKFFTNTLDRHGSGQRPDVQDPVPKYGCNGFGSASSFSGIETNHEEGTISELEYADLRGILEQSRVDYEESLHNDKVKISGREIELSRTVNEPQRNCMRGVPLTLLSTADSCANGIAVSGYRLSGDAKDLATSRIQGLRISDDASKSSPSSSEEGISPLGKAPHAPHLYFSHSYIGNGKMKNESLDQKQPENFGSVDNKVSSGLLQVRAEEIGSIVHCDQDKDQLVSNHEVLTLVKSKEGPSLSSPVACSLDDFHPGYHERASVCTAGSPEALNPLSDLSGDYESNLKSLEYGRWCCEYASSMPIPAMPQPLHSQFQSENSWDVIQWPAQFGQNVFPGINANGVIPQPAFYLMNPPIAPGGAFGMEEKPKPRGTGTYFPNTNHYRDRSLAARGRNHAPVRSPRNNGRPVTPSETNLLERSRRELSHAQIPVHHGVGKAASSDFPQLGSPGGKAYPNTNGLMLPSERVVEFGSGGNPPLVEPLLESSGQPNSGSSFDQNSSLSLPAAGMQRPKLMLGMSQDRVAVRSYHLKDEDDFPPLSLSECGGKG